MVVYIAHTMDKYELPIAVADSAQELAKILGTTSNSILSSISHEKKDGKRRRYKKIVVEDIKT